MYARIMAMVMAIILLLTASLSAVALVTLRDREIATRLEELKKEAREIAFLAAQNTESTPSLLFSLNSTTEKYLGWKAAKVNQDFGAYILVVDRRGRAMDNIKSAYQEDPDFVASLNGRELNEALGRVLGGDDIDVRVMTGGDPTFTVGVPFVRSGRVLGAVLIQTKAQVIEAGVADLLWPVVLVALGAVLLAGGFLLFFIRRAMRPLRELTEASVAMAAGDFSVRVHPERTIRETEELSRAFNTMADKLGQTEASRREFVANVSHELRSPITSIRGFVEGMEDGTIPPEEHPKYLAVVSDETRRLSKLIGDLLALSRLERDDAELSYSDFDMCEMLRRALIRRVNDIEAKHMDVVCDFDDGPCLVHADSDRIEQVVVNLLDNAIKFTPEGGTITLRIRPEDGICTVTVADDGIGISPEDRPRVFERFFTEDRAHTAGKGTGLGLSICQRIMEMHGQSIRLLDTDRGAAFAFTLRMAKQ